MVAVANQRHHRHLQQLAELAERGGQHGRGAAERIARLRIDHRNVSVVDHRLDLADERDIARKLALADTADVPEQAFAADESVDRHDIVRAVRENRLRRHFEIQKGVMIAQ